MLLSLSLHFTFLFPFLAIYFILPPSSVSEIALHRALWGYSSKRSWSHPFSLPRHKQWNPSPSICLLRSLSLLFECSLGVGVLYPGSCGGSVHALFFVFLYHWTSDVFNILIKASVSLFFLTKGTLGMLSLFYVLLQLWMRRGCCVQWNMPLLALTFSCSASHAWMSREVWVCRADFWTLPLCSHSGWQTGTCDHCVYLTVAPSLCVFVCVRARVCVYVCVVPS